MKINPLATKSFNRYFAKNTVKARYERNLDATVASSIALGIQILRLPDWQIHDIGITAGFGTLAIKNFTEAIKNKIALNPIKKRAIEIKNKRAK